MTLTLTDDTLERARAGDEQAFRALIDPHRRELQLQIYRIVGSLQEAEDLLQETLLAAWTGLDQFEGRSSLRGWLYRIATNRALDALRAGRRRPESTVRMTGAPEPSRRVEPVWLDPYPDALLDGIATDAPGPDARYELRESVAVARANGIALDEQEMIATAWRTAERLSSQYSSTAQDILRGKHTEIDALNGHVAQRGKALGVDTPVNRALHALVKLREAGDDLA